MYEHDLSQTSSTSVLVMVVTLPLNDQDEVNKRRGLQVLAQMRPEHADERIALVTMFCGIRHVYSALPYLRKKLSNISA